MKASPYAWLALLLTVCFTLATGLELRALRASPRASSDNVLEKMMGDGRRMFANQFFTMADVYFHSGYYPSIFDRQDTPKASAMSRESDDHDGHDHAKHAQPEARDDHDGHDHDKHAQPAARDDHDGHDHDKHAQPAARDEHEDPDAHDAHEKEFDFLGEPRDWIERFGRHFIVTEHTHLANGKQKEILPWLRMAAEMDPQMVETYTVAAFWLRSELGKPKDAEAFLREGLQNNPDSYEILFSLGRVYYEDYFDINRARNVWKMAMAKWSKQTLEARTASARSYAEIALNLGRLEDVAGNGREAIRYLQMAKPVSPNPESLQNQIDKLEAKLATPKP